MKFKLGELFAGPGGIAEGAKLAKSLDDSNSIVHAWANDFDKDTVNTYIKNICPNNASSVICSDIRKLNYDRLAHISDIDALAFGFPCNDFSVVGKQKGMDGVYGPLYSYGIKALQRFNPKWFLAENVSGLRNSNDGKAFKLILSAMEDAGYKITPHLYKFSDYGVPQARQRIIIIGIRNDIDIKFRVPSPEPFKNRDVSSQHALEVPPIPDWAQNNELTNQSETVKKRLSYIKPGENAFTANIPEELQLHVKGAKLSQIYKRLEPDKPSYTITGSGGGGTHVYHWAENRALTNRERARLQTFPDNYEFVGGKESVRKQIGMAVPVQGAKVVLDAVLNSFAGIDYPHIDNNIDILKLR